MGTIVQEYGPIYGEAVNGTVQGRPNGSVYVPLSNTIALTIPAGTSIQLISGTYKILHTAATLTAEAQDLASYMRISIFSDSACTTQVGTSRNITAGNFNGSWGNISYGTTALTVGDPYYVRAELINNGVAVATSNIVEVTGA